MYIQQGTDKDVFTGEGGGRVGERNLLLCWRKEGTSLTFGNFTVNFCNKSKFSSWHLLIPPIPARSVHDSGVLLLFCELHEKYHINNRTSSIHVQYIFLFQYCRWRCIQHWYNINITSYDIVDISLTLTSSTSQHRRCSTDIEFTPSTLLTFLWRLHRPHGNVYDVEPILNLHWLHRRKGTM